MAQTQICRGTATRVYNSDTYCSVRYHDTTVASKIITPDGHTYVTLHSGGYRSRTTKLRINQFAAQFCAHKFGVLQRKGEWFVWFEIPRFFDGQYCCDIPFEDNITFWI